MRFSTSVLGALIALAIGAAPVFAQDEQPPEQAVEPRPDEARNLERDDNKDSSVRVVARVALLPVRGVLYVVYYPFRKGLFYLDRFGVIARVGRLLSGDSPITFFPSAKLEAGFGITYGLGVGYKKYLRTEFLFGGEARQIYGGKARTRELLGERLELDVEIELQRLKNSRFNGIGNADTSEMVGTAAIDPLIDDTAIETRFNQDIFRVELGGWVRPVDELGVRLSGTYLRRRYDTASDENAVELTDAYFLGSLVSYQDGLDQIYGELRVSYDDREQPHPLVTTALPTEGWHLNGWVGLTHGIEDDLSNFVRLGADLQQFVHLFGGDRVLIPRLRVEAVTGDIDEVPFVDLPTLGGSRVLRGYQRGRYRDRIAAAAMLEYRFPLHRLLSGYLFADTGRVYREVSDFTLDDLHFGGGGGIIVHSADRFFFRLQVGGGEDGVVVNASFSPSDRVKRVTRRR